MDIHDAEITVTDKGIITPGGFEIPDFGAYQTLEKIFSQNSTRPQ